MAMAVQKLYPDAKVTIGPWIDNGFYYDFDMEPLTDKDLKGIKKEMVSMLCARLLMLYFPIKGKVVSLGRNSWSMISGYRFFFFFNQQNKFQDTKFISYILCRIGSLVEICHW